MKDDIAAVPCTVIDRVDEELGEDALPCEPIEEARVQIALLDNQGEVDVILPKWLDGMGDVSVNEYDLAFDKVIGRIVDVLAAGAGEDVSKFDPVVNVHRMILEAGRLLHVQERCGVNVGRAGDLIQHPVHPLGRENERINPVDNPFWSSLEYVCRVTSQVLFLARRMPKKSGTQLFRFQGTLHSMGRLASGCAEEILHRALKFGHPSREVPFFSARAADGILIPTSWPGPGCDGQRHRTDSNTGGITMARNYDDVIKGPLDLSLAEKKEERR